MGLYMGLLHKCKYQCTNMNTNAFIDIHTNLIEIQIWKTNDQYQYYQNVLIATQAFILTSLLQLKT